MMPWRISCTRYSCSTFSTNTSVARSLWSLQTSRIIARSCIASICFTVAPVNTLLRSDCSSGRSSATSFGTTVSHTLEMSTSRSNASCCASSIPSSSFSFFSYFCRFRLPALVTTLFSARSPKS